MWWVGRGGVWGDGEGDGGGGFGRGRWGISESGEEPWRGARWTKPWREEAGGK